MRMRDVLGVSFLITAGAAAHAQAPAAVALTPEEMHFSTDGLAMPGMGQANLVGDPKKPGPYTVRLRFPDGYRIEPHYHPDPREVIILSGTYLTGYGSVFEPSALKELPAGSFYTEPAHMPHFIVTRGPVVIQVSGVGPSARSFVHSNPVP
jgi:quercetin dioxygenase-like cupin family protein